MDVSAKGKFNDEESENINTDDKITINTIQRTVFVERLPNPLDIKTFVRDYLPFDFDNLYPNKIKAIADRSGSTKTAIGTLSSFISGEGFGDDINELILNDEKQTFWDILRFITTTRAMFDGICLHFNYNLLGEIIEINEINFEALRYSPDMDKVILNQDWRRYNKKKVTVYDVFNPGAVLEQMKRDGGTENYKGQVLYWTPRKQDVYALCRFDSVLDDAQFEAESKIYKLSCIQNDFAIGGIIKYPYQFDNTKEINKLKSNVKQSKGSRNAGKNWLLPITNEMVNSKLFEPISRNNIDGLFTNQNKESKFNIYAAFQQPPILNGIATQGMFNQESFEDAFNYYNSYVETDRKEIEKILSEIISVSIWANLGDIKIIPKVFIERKETKQGENTSTDDRD